MTRTLPFPDCLLNSFHGANDEIEHGMVGPVSDFLSVGGTVHDLNLTAQLKTIDLPVLLAYGRYDTVVTPTIDMMLHEIPHATALYLNQSAHFSMLDQPGDMNDAIAAFLRQVEDKDDAGSWNHVPIASMVRQSAVVSDVLQRSSIVAMAVFAAALLVTLTRRMRQSSYRSLA